MLNIGQRGKNYNKLEKMCLDKGDDIQPDFEEWAGSD